MHDDGNVMEELTFPVGVAIAVLNVAFDIVVSASQTVQSKVGDLEHETRVDNAIGGLQIAVGAYVGAVQELHATHDIMHERQLEHPVQLKLFILEYVLQRSLGTVFGEQETATLIQAGAIELDQVIVLQILHAFQF